MSFIEDLLADKDKHFALFFNGGKDSTVLLHLVQQASMGRKVLMVYIEDDDEFPEIREYVAATLPNVLRYNDMKEAIRDVTDRYSITHIFTGIRKTDPYGAKTDLIAATDADWPFVYLVNPLLHWTYEDIWDYILKNDLKYCSLYDQGYTSLGNTKNTKKNPLLQHESGYYPACMLKDATQERSGRILK